VFSPSDGTADPGKAAPAVAAAIMKLGGSVHQNCAARGIETEGGRVSGVITEAGVIKTRTAVLAGGAWASSFCRQLGIRFPQASVRQSILSVSPVAGGPAGRRGVCRRRVRHAPHRRPLCAGHQRAGARRCDAAVPALRPAVRADVRQALAQSASGGWKACVAATKRWRVGGWTRRRPWSACASSTRSPMPRR
jgi:glycine/D-amino acid oxidase-like deaminating enzyme